jgi:hypothetical protein
MAPWMPKISKVILQFKISTKRSTTGFNKMHEKNLYPAVEIFLKPKRIAFQNTFGVSNKGEKPSIYVRGKRN